MRTNLNNFGQNFYKNTDAQAAQINPIAEECFQAQTLTVKINTYNDITMNQAQGKEHRDEGIQQHPGYTKRINKYYQEPTYCISLETVRKT